MTIPISYRLVKRAVISALRSGRFQHEARRNINVKNLLATGDVSPEFVERVILNSSGAEHLTSPHHCLDSVDVHVIASGGWYVKFYFVGNPDTMFISVHQ